MTGLFTPLWRRYPQTDCPSCGGAYPDYTAIGCVQPEQCLDCAISERLREDPAA